VDLDTPGEPDISVDAAAFGSTADRPAGIAERWLVAVGDSTREGLEDDGVERADEHGALPELAARAGLVVSQAAEDGERAFEDVRVGRASTARRARRWACGWARWASASS